MRIKIVADSSSDMHAIENEMFELVPLKIMNDLNEYVDTKDLDVKAMAEDLKSYKGKTSTSCPNTSDWIKAFDGADIVYAFTITSKLSGSYNSCLLAKSIYEEENKGKKVYVIDSLTAGPAIKLLIDHLQQCLDSKMDPQEAYESTIAYQQNVHTIFSLESVNNLARNGRVKPVVAAAVGALNLRIIGIANEGVIDPIHKVRGDKKAIKQIFATMLEKGYHGGKVYFSHCFNEKNLQLLKQTILEKYPNAIIETMPCGGLVSFYAELGGVVVGYEG